MKMTATLLNAVQWLADCPPSWKERALESLRNTLTQGFTETPATRRGTAYEAQVNASLMRGEKFEGVQEPLNKLRGMRQQKWIAPLNITTSDGVFTFRGKLDYCGVPSTPFLERWEGLPTIVDLKTTGSEIKADRYLNNIQHVIYCLAENIPRFVYMPARFDSPTSLEPIDVQEVIVDLTDTIEASMELLVSRISETIKVIKDYNLWSAYFDIFNGGRL